MLRSCPRSDKLRLVVCQSSRQWKSLTISASAKTDSYAFVCRHSISQEKRKKTAEQKEFNYRQRQNRQKRLKTAETAVPVLSAGVRATEEQNTALNAALQEREYRIDLLTRRLEAKKGECAAAVKARRESEQAVRDTESALLVSEARHLALKGELATASDKISSLDNDVAQLSFALAIANASAASRAVLCSQIFGVA